MLPPEAQAIVEEEESLLARAKAALAAAVDRRRPEGEGDLRSVDALRQIRDEALTANEHDLPALLGEMAVRQRLIERPPMDERPDPRSPYLAHLRLREGDAAKDYLLGTVSFIDTAADVRIVDWRVAPVARIFYRHREGDEFEERFPGRLAAGIVDARRIVVVSDGVLVRILTDAFAIERRDGEWLVESRGRFAFGGGGGGTAARPGTLGIGIGAPGRAAAPDVTALLDAEQFAAVSAPPEVPLLVLGTAGSGKTTVALHRVAHLSAREPTQYPLARSEIVVPEEGLARLWRKLLAPLGAGGARVRTIDRWAADVARQVFGRLPRVWHDAPGRVAALKRHPALHEALRRRFADHPASRTGLRPLRRKLSELLSDRVFVGEVVAASRGDLPSRTIEETVRHTMLQLATPVAQELESIVDEDRTRTVDGLDVAHGTPDELAGTIDVEELPVLLFLRAWRGDLGPGRIAQLVLDEAEDASLFEAVVLGKQLGDPASTTIAGDEAQQTTSAFPGWSATLDALGVGEAETCRLAVSYRCPRPVAELARRVLGTSGDAVTTARDGPPVGIHRFPDEQAAGIFLAAAIAELLDREPGASIGVVVRDPEAARRFHEVAKGISEARLVLDGSFSFEPGLDVTDVEGAKGLEWDYVVVPDVTAAAYPDTPESRRKLHVAVTRASHQLWIVLPGAPSPIVPAD